MAYEADEHGGDALRTPRLTASELASATVTAYVVTQGRALLPAVPYALTAMETKRLTTSRPRTRDPPRSGPRLPHETTGQVPTIAMPLSPTLLQDPCPLLLAKSPPTKETAPKQGRALAPVADRLLAVAVHLVALKVLGTQLSVWPQVIPSVPGRLQQPETKTKLVPQERKS